LPPNAESVGYHDPSVPYVDPTQASTVREADAVVRFGNQLSMSGDSWYLAAVIECKSPTAKPWAALIVPDKSYGLRDRTAQVGLSR
jgi:hypothetical protein